jgi:hypothetical protein
MEFFGILRFAQDDSKGTSNGVLDSFDSLRMTAKAENRFLRYAADDKQRNQMQNAWDRT